jgi:small subunit ribosomal protein S6
MAIEPKKYETLYLVRPDISPEDLLTIQNRVEQSVAGNGGEMIKSEKWAEKDLAYRIENYTRGTYSIAVYSADPKAVTDIERYFNLSKNNVLRFITVQYIEEQKPAGAAGSTTPQTSQQEEQSAFQTPWIPEEPPQASKEPPQASKEPPQASKEPPQASKEPPQASKEPPQEGEEQTQGGSKS